MTMVTSTTTGPAPSILFHKIYKQGFLHRHISSEVTITNQRVILTNYNNRKPTTYNYLLSDCSDILVAGQKRVGTGTHYGMSYGYGMRGNYGISNWQSTNIGSLIFFVQGAPAITLNGLEDPQGVCRMAKSARKYLLDKHAEPAITDGMNSLFKN
jgi:hypothetical protein